MHVKLLVEGFSVNTFNQYKALRLQAFECIHLAPARIPNQKKQISCRRKLAYQVQRARCAKRYKDSHIDKYALTHIEAQ